MMNAACAAISSTPFQDVETSERFADHFVRGCSVGSRGQPSDITTLKGVASVTVVSFGPDVKAVVRIT